MSYGDVARSTNDADANLSPGLGSRERPPRFSRRRLLQVGAAGGLGLSLPALLAAEAQAKATGKGNRPKGCIFIVQYGGAPQQDTWDMKPLAPENIRGAFQPIATNVPGIQICEKFPLLAQRADKYCLIRSMTTTDGNHDGAMHICMTGQPRPNEQTPYFGSVVSRLTPPSGELPSYVWLQNLAGDVKPWYLTGGSLGMAHSPLRVGTDLDNPSKPGFRVSAFDPPKEVSTDRLARRLDLWRQAERESPRLPLGSPGDTARPGVFSRFQERAHELVAGAEARRAFDLGLETPETRDRYGRSPLGQNLLMARRLIEAGVRLVTVVAWTGTPPGEAFRNVQTWDMHGVLYKPNDSIFGSSAYGLSWALPRVDEAVSSLLDDLDDRGLLDDTLVAMVGEFGRTPTVNNRGRDHWNPCYSALLAGAGIRGGMVYGASDAHAAYVKDKPVGVADFHATLYEAIGIPPDTRFGPDGFSLKASDGHVVRDLF